MNNLKSTFHSLKILVEYVEIFIILISLFVLVFILIRSSATSLLNLRQTNNPHPFNKIKTDILKVSSFILTLILPIEVMKIFFIRSYLQLVIIAVLAIIKIILAYYTNYEIKALKLELHEMNDSDSDSNSDHGNY